MKSIGNYLIDKEVLGKGQFGLVQKCHLKTDATKKFAVKVIQKKSLTERLFNNLKNEISILTKINSPHVIKLYDIQRTENNYYLVMELCNGGDLENLKDVRGKFSEIEARLILQQLVQGFKEIYKQQVMHRDLKLANILVNFPQENFANLDHMTDLDKNNYIKARLKQMDLIKSGFQVKIADLGFARELQYEDLSQTICGTPLVMAPEVLNGKKYNHKADVWSLGIVFFEMITGFTPFTGRDKNDLKNNLEKGDYKLPKKIQISLQGLDFLNKCLQFDQTERYSWEELCTHPYITSDPREEQPDEQMKLMYSQAHGQYIHDQIDQSTIMMKANPYSYLNNRNAILLNCKDPKKFEEAYEQAIAKHFEKDMINQQPPQQQLNPLAQSMGNFGDIVDLQEDIKEEEKFQNQFQQQINQQQQQRQVFEQKHDVKKEPIKPKEEKVNMNELIQAQRNLVLNTNQKQKENEMKEIERKAKEIEQRQLEKLRLEEEEREIELQKQREQEEFERQVKEMQIRQQRQQEDLEEKKDLSDLSELQYQDASDQIDNDVLRQIKEQEKAKEMNQAQEEPQIQVEQQLPELQFQFEEVKPFNEYEDLAKDKTYVEHYLEKNNTKSEMNGVTIHDSYFEHQ